MALAPSILSACERWAPRPALTHHGRTLTYAQLSEQILALSSAYRSLGIKPGERVVCALPTSPEHIVAAAAAWECQAIHVGAHRDSTGPELAALVCRTKAAAVICQAVPGAPDGLAPWRAVRAAHPETAVILHGQPRDGGELSLAALLRGPALGPSSPAPRSSDRTDLLLMTSGTTGEPKAVMETLPALWAKMQFFADAVCPGDDDVHLMYLPICHAFGLKLSLLALASGGRLVLLDRFSPADALRLIGDEGVTVLPATPTHLALLLGALDPDRHRIESLRWAISAASALTPDAIEGVYARLGARMLYVYGCSEGFLTQTTDPDEIRAGSVGTHVFGGRDSTISPDGSVAILDPEHDRPLRPGGVGEIAFGASRPVRYWDEPATGGAACWYRTGDLGRLDASGRLFVCGRLKDVVNRGLKVSCGEIEAALARHPGVAEGVVIATPDAILGEAICACVVARGTNRPTLADVRSELGESLGRHKLPDELCLVESIPRSPVGKIDRAALRALVLERHLPRARLRTQDAATADRRPTPVISPRAGS